MTPVANRTPFNFIVVRKSISLTSFACFPALSSVAALSSSVTIVFAVVNSWPTMSWLSLALCLVAVAGPIYIAAEDLTRTPFAHGPSVVEAVINIIRESCLFADDKRFLRRQAYVESDDGVDPKTFLPGNYGGIWQVDEQAFLRTKNDPDLSHEYDIIRDVMGINWNSVSWHSLTIPLYSGIAAALYAKLQAGSGGMSWKVEEQGQFWSQHYHGSSPAANFTQLANLLDLGCNVTQEIDLVFVIDQSNSLTHDDFLRAVNFMRQVVNGFEIGPSKTQVGVVTYSSHARVEFDLNDHRTKSTVEAAINSLPNHGGGTQTDAGINLAVNNVFSPLGGGRPNAVKVMIVITDGASDDTINTAHAADNAHLHGIVSFSVGVGRLADREELQKIATSPSCTHTFVASGYDEIKFLKEEIQKATCNAPLFINQTYSCSIEKCPPLAVVSGPGGTTIQTNISCGGMNVYTSVNNPYPSPAQYDLMQVVLGNNAIWSEHFFNVSNQNLYINLQDNQGYQGYFHGSAGCIATITPLKGDHTVHSKFVRCYEDNREVECDQSFFNCSEKWNFPNPCTDANILAGILKFPHPYESSKFLMCDLSKKLYIVLCPPGEYYERVCQQCVGNSAYTSNCGTQPSTSSNIANPCTRQNILAGNMFFEFPGDHTKYIHCDVWGHPWENDCRAGMSWEQNLLTCVKESTYNPCLHHVPGTPYLYPHQCDPHQYIHCDTNDQSFIQSCQLDYVFLPISQTCVYPGFPGSENLVNTCNGGTVLRATTQSGATIGFTQAHTSHSSHYYDFSTLWSTPCTKENILANKLYFPYRYSNKQYIQCDLNGRMYLRDCPTNNPYYDPYVHTCVDGPVFVDGLLGKR